MIELDKWMATDYTDRIFNNIWHSFLSTPLWDAMVATVEDSPWHREANVAVHTCMLLNQYHNAFSNISRTPDQRRLTMVCSLFHDVGKPKAEQIKFSEARGHYRAYHGHELLSARIWVDWALSNRTIHMYTLQEISDIAFMIEHHVPFAIKDHKKRLDLKNGIINRVGEAGHVAWLDFLHCDQFGRISDDSETKLAAFIDWTTEWRRLV